MSDALWADVAAARLEEPTRELDAPDGDSLRRAVSLAVRRIHQRADREEKDRTADNDAFHEARKLSLESEHRGKVDLIRRRIQTLRARDKTGMIPLQEAQLRNAHCRHEEVLAELDKERHCRLDLSHVAVCVVEVAP